MSILPSEYAFMKLSILNHLDFYDPSLMNIVF